jgi:hypothetical protein
MKLLFCYLVHLDCLSLGHVKRLMNWGGLYNLKDFIKKNSVFISSSTVILKHLRTECKILARATFLGLHWPSLFVMQINIYLASKTLFIVPTDAYNTQIISACCAGVQWTTRLHNRLICRHNIDYVYTDKHRKTIFVVLAKDRTAPWWWFLHELKHVRASFIILNCFNILWFL